MSDEQVMRRLRYAVVGGLLGLGAPAGLLFVRLRRRALSMRYIRREIKAECETYVYSAASTTLVFALFGGALGHYADRLAQLATTDSLTGLFNPRAFNERLHQELGRAARYQDSLSVLLIDLDGLKRVNDQYGHEAGNAALQSVAAAIRSGVREIDVSARLGGDEFGVLVPGTNQESAVVLAERLRALVATPVKGGAAGRGMTISIGVASLVPANGEGPTAVALMAAADNGLYQAKREGGDRVVCGASA